MIDRAEVLQVQGQTIRVAQPEDLIVTKAIAMRARDISDIETLARLYPDLDKQRILTWVREFAELLESPELVPQIQKLLGT